jgi:uncharacterized cofD-like protein
MVSSSVTSVKSTPRSHRLLEPARPDLRVVALGGGTGLPTALRGLRAALFESRPWDPERDQARLTAIATVAGDGGISGTLRASYQLPSPGDIRNCLVALAADDPVMSAVFDFRFTRGNEVAGHSLGNLILTAFTELEQDFARAVARVGRMLSIRGRVLPSTTRNVVLRAELSDGTMIEGESGIAGARSPIRRLRLHPGGAAAPPEALDALERADLIVLGPGSLYSSLVAVLLAEELPEAIARSRARVVLVMNLMTEPGETDGYTAVDHLMAIRRHAPRIPIHDILINTAPLAPELVARYAAQGAMPVPADVELLWALGLTVVERDLLAAGDDVRHDPDKLGRALLARADQVGGQS